MTKTNLANLSANYQQQKTAFLDSLQPSDFRNGGSFNQAEYIIDELNKAYFLATQKKENADEFIKKAVNNLFRNDSLAAQKAINLAKIYLEMQLTT